MKKELSQKEQQEILNKKQIIKENIVVLLLTVTVVFLIIINSIEHKTVYGKVINAPNRDNHNIVVYSVDNDEVFRSHMSVSESKVYKGQKVKMKVSKQTNQAISINPLSKVK